MPTRPTPSALPPMPRESPYLFGNPEADALLTKTLLVLVIGLVLAQQVQ